MLKRRKRGFTLVELLFTVATVTTLTSAAIPALSGFMEGGKDSACRRNRDQLVNEYRYVQLMHPDEEIKLWKLLYTDTYAAESNVKGLECPSEGSYYMGPNGGICCTEHDGPDTSGMELLMLVKSHDWEAVRKGIAASSDTPPRYVFERAHRYFDSSGDFVALSVGNYVTQPEADYYRNFRALVHSKLQGGMVEIKPTAILTEASAVGESLRGPIQRGALYAYNNRLYTWRGPAGYHNPPTDPEAAGAGSNWLRLIQETETPT